MKPLSIHRDDLSRLVSRRWFLRDAGVGLGSMALLSLLGGNTHAATKAANPLAPRKPHFTPKAKRVIHIFQAGAPSHLDLFDYKPELAKRTGKLPPPELLKDYRAAFINPNSALLGPKFNFKRHGQSGAEITELLPNISGLADDICIVRSMHTDAVNHAPAQIM
ncbi:MAG TPA: DUF1501 domain-containing protein, partial [Chthoniobacteraceae bacterium]|nr:DUF1501 domain-containing protein [Chthoniobacteraceae bacterium]